MLEVPIHDEVAFGMVWQPPLAAPHQGVDFGLADKVVFVVVEHRDEHVEMGEQGFEGDVRFECHRVIRTLPPF